MLSALLLRRLNRNTLVAYHFFFFRLSAIVLQLPLRRHLSCCDRRIKIKPLIDPGLSSFNRAHFRLLLTVKLLKPILDRTQLLAIILKPRDDDRPGPPVCEFVRSCRNDNTVILIQQTGHPGLLIQAIGPGWPFKRERKAVQRSSYVRYEGLSRAKLS